MGQTPFLEKAQEAIAAAQLLIEASCLQSAANRAYYAVFHAARAALIAAHLSSPERVWSHLLIQGGFSQLVHRQKIYPAHLLSDIAWLRTVRELADYQQDMVSSRMAREAVKRAAVFVKTVIQQVPQ